MVDATDFWPASAAGKLPLDGPAYRGFTITPDDATPFTYLTRAIWVGGAGNVVVVWSDDTTSTLVGVVAGTLLPVRAKRVNSTSTTATSMVGLY